MQLLVGLAIEAMRETFGDEQTQLFIRDVAETLNRELFIGEASLDDEEPED